MELLERLAALVPPPRFHLLRYHGVLAPRARARERIVPAQPVAVPAAADGSASAASCGHRLRWATLLARVFSSDLSECAACGGRLRILAALTDPASIRTYPEGVGLPAMPRRGPRLSRCWSSRPDLPSRPRRRRRAYGWVCPQRSLRPRIDADTGRQVTKLYCEFGRRTGNDPQGSCQTLAVRSAP